MVLPDGLQYREAGVFKFVTFARKDHPAIASWGAAAWTKWPHIMVQLGDRQESPVVQAARGAGLDRRFAVQAPNFAAIPPLLACTDLLATIPTIVMHEALERFGLCALPPPIEVEPMPHRFVWSFRLANDPATQWLLAILVKTFADVLEASEVSVTRLRSVKCRQKRRGMRKL
jgi:DNA-binding transcriptional LysR family regulator